MGPSPSYIRQNQPCKVQSSVYRDGVEGVLFQNPALLNTSCCERREICRKEQKHEGFSDFLGKKEAIGPRKNFLTYSEAGHETVM